VAAAKRDVIVSAEYFSVFPDAETCAAALDYFRQRFDRVHGIIYAREPLSYIGSALQQALKVNMPKPDFIAYYPGYRKRLALWDKAMPRAHLDFVLFHPSGFLGGDLLTDFATRTRIDPAWLATRAGVPPVNESLTAEATAAIVRFRRAHGASELLGPLRKANTTLVAAMGAFGTRPFGIDPESLAQPLADRERDVVWIEKKIGQPFPKYRPKDGAAVFADFDDLAAFGAGLAPAFAEWQQGRWPGIPVAGRTVEDMMANVQEHLARTFA
jgi:hypothetical protein